MTIQVTITCDNNPSGTAVKVQHVSKLQDGTEAVTTLNTIGAGQSHVAHIWDGQDIRITEIKVGDAQ